MSYTYKYPRPMLCVDIALIQKQSGKESKILLIKRKNKPFKDSWALPGGFMDMDERLDKAAYRELEEETSLKDIKLKRFDVYDSIGRDPRGRTISMVYYAVVEKQNINAKAGDDAAETCFFPLSQLPELAFDHKVIIQDLLRFLAI